MLGGIQDVSATDSDDDHWLKAEWSKYLSAFGNSGDGLVELYVENVGNGTAKDAPIATEHLDDVSGPSTA